jgi:hypothetical protein
MFYICIIKNKKKMEKKVTNNYRNAGRKKILNATRKVSLIPNDKLEDYEIFVKSLQFPNKKLNDKYLNI